VPIWWQKGEPATAWFSLSRLWILAGPPHYCRIGGPAAKSSTCQGLVARGPF